MASLWGNQYSKNEIKQWVGDMSQIAGAKSYELKDGKAYGTRAIDVATGSGFEFTVLPDRGMDIAWASYKGRSLTHITNNGIVSSNYYEPQGEGFFRSFFGGLLTTCGLSNVGLPCEVKGVEYGQHGRISNIPAEKVCVNEFWDNDDYIIQITGNIRETRFFGENLVLTRKIETALGEKKLVLHDTVENQGYSPVPLMLLYHFNLGFPLLNAGSRLLAGVQDTEFYDEHSAKGKADYMVFHGPTRDYFRQVFFHKLKHDEDGKTLCTLIDGESNPLGICLKFNVQQLPEFIEFKMMGPSEYVVSLEPSNCIPFGRAQEGIMNRLQFVEPGEKKEFEIELGVIEGIAEINRISEEIKALR